MNGWTYKPIAQGHNGEKDKNSSHPDHQDDDHHDSVTVALFHCSHMDPTGRERERGRDVKTGETKGTRNACADKTCSLHQAGRQAGRHAGRLKIKK